MIATAEILRLPCDENRDRSGTGTHRDDRYAVYTFIDGKPTSWSCPHLHHSPAAAKPCLKSHLAHVAEWLAEAALSVIQDTPSGPLYQAARPGRRENIREETRRFIWPHNGPAVPLEVIPMS